MTMTNMKNWNHSEDHNTKLVEYYNVKSVSDIQWNDFKMTSEYRTEKCGYSHDPNPTSPTSLKSGLLCPDFGWQICPEFRPFQDLLQPLVV